MKSLLKAVRHLWSEQRRGRMEEVHNEIKKLQIYFHMYAFDGRNICNCYLDTKRHYSLLYKARNRKRKERHEKCIWERGHM